MQKINQTASREKLIPYKKNRKEIDPKQVQAFLNRPVQKVENLNLSLKKSYEKGFFDKPVFNHFKILKSKRHNKEDDSVSSQEKEGDSDFDEMEQRTNANRLNVSKGTIKNKKVKRQKTKDNRRSKNGKSNDRRIGKGKVMKTKQVKEQSSSSSQASSLNQTSSRTDSSEESSSVKKIKNKRIVIKKKKSISSSNSPSNSQSSAKRSLQSDRQSQHIIQQDKPTRQNKQTKQIKQINHDKQTKQTKKILKISQKYEQNIQSTTKQEQQQKNIEINNTKVQQKQQKKKQQTKEKNRQKKISLKKSGKFNKQPKQISIKQQTSKKLQKVMNQSFSQSYLIPPSKIKPAQNQKIIQKDLSNSVQTPSMIQDENNSKQIDSLSKNSSQSVTSNRKSNRDEDSSQSGTSSAKEQTQKSQQNPVIMPSIVIKQQNNHHHEKIQQTISVKKSQHLTINSKIVIQSIYIVPSQQPRQSISSQNQWVQKMQMIKSIFQHAPCCSHATSQQIGTFRKKKIIENQDVSLAQTHQRKQVGSHTYNKQQQGDKGCIMAQKNFNHKLQNKLKTQGISADNGEGIHKIVKEQEVFNREARQEQKLIQNDHKNTSRQYILKGKKRQMKKS